MGKMKGEKAAGVEECGGGLEQGGFFFLIHLAHEVWDKKFLRRDRLTYLLLPEITKKCGAIVGLYDIKTEKEL
jgi:hypothetical protein